MCAKLRIIIAFISIHATLVYCNCIIVIAVLIQSKSFFFFQGIDYDPIYNQLIWAETDGDKPEESSCRIMIKSLSTGIESELLSLDTCYPFSLTSDQDYIYWSDWAKLGIMRISRKNPEGSLIKLVNSPPFESEEGVHMSVFGITNTRKNFTELSRCLGKPENPLNPPQKQDLLAQADSKHDSIKVNDESKNSPNQANKDIASESLGKKIPTHQSTSLEELETNDEIAVEAHNRADTFPAVRSAASSINCR